MKKILTLSLLSLFLGLTFTLPISAEEFEEIPTGDISQPGVWAGETVHENTDYVLEDGMLKEVNPLQRTIQPTALTFTASYTPYYRLVSGKGEVIEAFSVRIKFVWKTSIIKPGLTDAIAVGYADSNYYPSSVAVNVNGVQTVGTSSRSLQGFATTFTRPSGKPSGSYDFTLVPSTYKTSSSFRLIYKYAHAYEKVSYSFSFTASGPEIGVSNVEKSDTVAKEIAISG